jgi:hypothetical protein
MRLPRQLVKNIEVVCMINGLDFQDAVAEGLDLWLARETELDVQSGRPDVQSSSGVHKERARVMTDDMMTDDVEDPPSSSSLFGGGAEGGRPDAQADREQSLLRFYAEQTGNPVRVADRDALRRVLQFHDAAIKAGILRSILLCKTPANAPRVNSLAYCEGAIAEIAESGVGGEYLDHLFTKVRKHRAGAQPTLPGVGGDLADLRRRRR